MEQKWVNPGRSKAFRMLEALSVVTVAIFPVISKQDVVSWYTWCMLSAVCLPLKRLQAIIAVCNVQFTM